MTGESLVAARLQVKAAELRMLPDGWDGEDSAPPDWHALERAVELALVVAPFFPTYEPALVPCSDGSVQVEWHADGFNVEMWVRRAG